MTAPCFVIDAFTFIRATVENHCALVLLGRPGEATRERFGRVEFLFRVGGPCAVQADKLLVQVIAKAEDLENRHFFCFLLIWNESTLQLAY